MPATKNGGTPFARGRSELRPARVRNRPFAGHRDHGDQRACMFSIPTLRSAMALIGASRGRTVGGLVGTADCAKSAEIGRTSRIREQRYRQIINFARSF